MLRYRILILVHTAHILTLSFYVYVSTTFQTNPLQKINKHFFSYWLISVSNNNSFFCVLIQWGWEKCVYWKYYYYYYYMEIWLGFPDSYFCKFTYGYLMVRIEWIVLSFNFDHRKKNKEDKLHLSTYSIIIKCNGVNNEKIV